MRLLLGGASDEVLLGSESGSNGALHSSGLRIEDLRGEIGDKSPMPVRFFGLVKQERRRARFFNLKIDLATFSTGLSII